MDEASNKEKLNRLFQAAREGSLSALDQLISRLRPLVYRKARRFVDEWEPGVGPSTLTQEVSWSLAKMIEKVRGSGNATLLKLVNKLIQTQGVSAYRHGHRAKRGGGAPLLPLDDVPSQAIDAGKKPDEQLEEKQRAHRLLVDIAQLPTRQRLVIEAVLAGEAPSSISSQFDCSEAAIANLLGRLKNKLQQTDDDPVPAPMTAALLLYLSRTAGGSEVDPDQFASSYPKYSQALREFLLWLESVRRSWTGASRD